MEDIVSTLPDVVWYLTQTGKDMWCRRPYGFFFTTEAAARKFLRSMGTKFELTPVGISSEELVSGSGFDALRGLRLTRIYLDPSIDAKTGEVIGTILRLEAVN